MLLPNDQLLQSPLRSTQAVVKSCCCTQGAAAGGCSNLAMHAEGTCTCCSVAKFHTRIVGCCRLKSNKSKVDAIKQLNKKKLEVFSSFLCTFNLLDVGDEVCHNSNLTIDSPATRQ